MKKCLFTNKATNQTKECMVGNIGELVFGVCQSVAETNMVIRWCNKHLVGEILNGDDYTIKLVESKDEISNAKEETPTTKEETKKAEEAKVELSPILKQFYEFKAKHPDAVLLFRCGDFYETYGFDAWEVSKILGITLTKSFKQKDKDGKPLALAGFPYHALDTYLPKLIRAGKRVAICDQLEDPRTKKIVKRGITELSNN